MAAANHSSSKLSHLGTGGLALVLLVGCSGGGTLLGGKDLRLFTFDDGGGIAEAAPALKPTVDVAVVGSTGQTRVVPVNAEPRQSHWCDYLREDTAVQTTIMRSPTLSGHVDESAKASISLGISLSTLAKAGLMEEAAEVRCRRYLAENGLQKMVFLAPQGLTAAGFRAKAEALARRKVEIIALKKAGTRALEEGLIDREAQAGLHVLGDQIMAEAETAKSQADRRIGDGDRNLAATLSKELLRAEIELEDLDSRMRTLDNFDLSVSAGLTDDLNDDNALSASEAIGGKVSFSIKLGAISPKRFEHERKASKARLRAITEEEGGLLWQIDAMRRAHEHAIDGLLGARKNIDNAIADIERLIVTFENVDNPEFTGAKLGAKMQLIKLRADKAGIDGSVVEIRASVKKLKLG